MRGCLILFLLTSAHAEEISHKKKLAGIAMLGVSAAAAVFAMISGAAAAQPTGCTQYSDKPECLNGPVSVPAMYSLAGISVVTSAVGFPLLLGGEADPRHRPALKRAGVGLMGVAAVATAVALIGAGLALGCDTRSDCYGAGLIMSTAGPSLAGLSLATGIPLVTF